MHAPLVKDCVNAGLPPAAPVQNAVLSGVGLFLKAGADDTVMLPSVREK